MTALIPETAFAALEGELHRQRIPINHMRKNSGVGRSVTFGLVNQRRGAPGPSSLNSKRAALWELLKALGHRWVCPLGVRWNAVTVNDCYRAERHRDRGNLGDSAVVAFGNYTGGALVFHEGSQKGAHDIRHRVLVGDFRAADHSVDAFVGQRYSLVFYYVESLGVQPRRRQEDPDDKG